MHKTSRDTIAGTVGGNIRGLRLDRSQTLAGLAERAGTSVRTLVEIEGGRQRQPGDPRRDRRRARVSSEPPLFA